jgi:hypothetical protein
MGTNEAKIMPGMLQVNKGCSMQCSNSDSAITAQVACLALCTKWGLTQTYSLMADDCST